MGRKNLHEECILCGDSPCTCGGKPKTKRKIDPRPPVAPPAEDIFDDAPVPVVAPRFSAPKAVERDLSAESALRCLRDIVCDADRRLIDRELSHPYSQDLDRRIASWKDRHGKKA